MLLVYSVDPDGKLEPQGDIRFDGNVLDVAVLPDQRTIIVSTDTAHHDASTVAIRLHDESIHLPLLQARSLANDTTRNGWRRLSLFEPLTPLGAESLSDLPEVPRTEPQQNRPGRAEKSQVYSPLGNFLYGQEHLRKKKDFTGADAEDEDGEE
jgi:hypothetical protein